MIYTVTFNPAVDYVVKVPRLELGQTNRTISEELQIGGKGINVSIVLNNLGHKNVALGFLAGFTGKYIQQELEHRGVQTNFVQLEQGTNRINIKIKSEQETEMNANGPNIPASALNQLYAKLDKLQNDDVLVLAGSIPKTLPDNIYEQILTRLSSRDVRIIVDATGSLLKNVLKYQPFLIKPNQFELEEIFGVPVTSTEDILCFAHKLQQLGAQNVLVSMGGKGAILLDANKKVHQISVAKGKVLNTVGSGDSMVAGFLAGYLETGDYGYALKLGSACGSATAFSMSLATEPEIMEVLAQY